MTDHRRIQRTLFRMQMDPAFAAAVRAGDPAALATTDLAPADAELVRGLDPAGVSADPGARRRLQVLGNLVSEHTASLALLASAGRDVLRGFPGSEAFHRAVREDRSLPLALGAWLGERAELGTEAGALLRLERAMAEVRRAPDRPGPELAPGEAVLASGVRLVDLPAGTLELATEVRRRIDAGEEAGDPGLPSVAAEGRETLLLAPRRSGDAGAWLTLGHRGLPDVHVERLAPPTDRLLRCLESPCTRARREALAGELGASAEELAGFVGSLVEDGLVRAADA